jgi:hypothetical protein
MNFLRKEGTDIARHDQLRYPKDRDKAVAALIGIQKGFCAYSERYLKPLDSVELEHFDPRKKNTEEDGFSNWHAVIRWMNAHKARSIEKYEPLPDVASWNGERIWYERGLFVCRDEDTEAKNLIDFLGVNRQEVFEERANHIARIRNMRNKVGDEMLMEFLSEDPEQLSFPTAIAAELGIPAFEIIDHYIEGKQE